MKRFNLLMLSMLMFITTFGQIETSKVYCEPSPIGNVQIAVPVYMENIPETVAYQFEITPPAPFKCIEVKPAEIFLKGGTGGMFLSNPNLKGKIRIAFAAGNNIKLDKKVKVCDLILEMKPTELFDFNDTFSGVWNIKGKLSVELVDNVLLIDYGDVSIMAAQEKLKK